MAPRANGLDRLDAILLLILASSVLASYLAFLARSPFIYGWDGPYYLTQVRHIARTGSLKYADPPLAFYYFYAIYVLVGDITLGVKVGTAIMVALMVVPVYCLVKQELGRRPEAVLSAVVLALNPQLLKLSSEWLKNLVGSTFLMFSAFSFARGVERDERKALVASSISLMATSLTHILAFSLSVLFLALYTIFTAICHKEKAADVLEAFILVSLAPTTLILAGFPLLPAYFSDLLKIKAFVNDVLFPSSNGSYYMPLLVEQCMAYAVLGVSIMGFLVAIKHALSREKEKAVLTLTLSTIGMLISAPITPPAWYCRIFLMGFFPNSILVPMVAYEVRLLSDIAPLLPPKLRHELTTAFAAFFLVLPTLLLSGLGSAFAGPSLSDVEFSDLMLMASSVPKGSVVVVAPNQALGYWAEYILDCDFSRELSPHLFTSYEHVLIIVGPGLDKPLLPMRLLYAGEVLALYELIPPPIGAGA